MVNFDTCLTKTYIVMVKKMLLFIGLLFLFVTPALPSVYSTKYIYLRSTESAKMKKRPRSIKLLPIHATLEMNQLQIYFCEPLSLVDIGTFRCKPFRKHSWPHPHLSEEVLSHAWPHPATPSR